MRDYDNDGLLIVMERLIKQTRSDYIAGGKIYFALYGDFPSDINELNDVVWPVEGKGKQAKRKRNKKITTNEHMRLRNMQDSWAFIIDDPYDIFKGRITPEEMISSLNKECKFEYFRDLYIKGMMEVYLSLIKMNMSLNVGNLSNVEARKYISDNKIYNNYILAKKEIKKLGKEDIFSELNSNAYNRVREAKKRKIYNYSNKKEDRYNDNKQGN